MVLCRLFVSSHLCLFLLGLNLSVYSYVCTILKMKGYTGILEFSLKKRPAKKLVFFNKLCKEKRILLEIVMFHVAFLRYLRRVIIAREMFFDKNIYSSRFIVQAHHNTTYFDGVVKWLYLGLYC